MAVVRHELRVEGMSCEHCAQSVVQALEAVPGVTGADVSLEGRKADVRIESDAVSTDQLIEAVAEAGYRAEAA